MYKYIYKFMYSDIFGRNCKIVHSSLFEEIVNLRLFFVIQLLKLIDNIYIFYQQTIFCKFFSKTKIVWKNLQIMFFFHLLAIHFIDIIILSLMYAYQTVAFLKKYFRIRKLFIKVIRNFLELC